MSGLFATFNIAKRGMNVQQTAINVTTHNIANANTEGYSRQVVDIKTTTPFGMPSFNSAAEAGQLGTGAEVTLIKRVRDTFLDYQIRVETSTQGTFEARDKFLSEIETIFNEPSDTGLSTLFGKFFDSWQQLSKQAQNSNARTVVMQQSQALADELNHTYGQLKKLKENAQLVTKDTVFDINNKLNQISQLNQQIIGVKIGGNEPNDLMDRRDLLIDELSAKYNIDLEKVNFEGNNLSPSDGIDKNDPFSNSYNVRAMFKDDIRRYSYINSIKKVGEGTYDLTYYKMGDMADSRNAVTIRVTNVDEKALKEIEQNRVLWADKEGNAVFSNGEKIPDVSSGKTISFDKLSLFKPSSGELKGYMSIQKDLDDYMDQLNKLAKALALSVNAVHSGKTSTGKPTDPNNYPADADYMPFFVNSSIAKYDTLGRMVNLESILVGEQDITAENISVNFEILKDEMKIKTRTNDDKFSSAQRNNIDGEKDGNRALAIAKLRNTLIKIQDIGTVIKRREDLFNPFKGGNNLLNNGLEIENNISGMTLDNYFKDTIDRLGVQADEAKRMVKNQKNLLMGLTQTKESISGVSFDEELSNLIMFQHAYQANAKIIATVDELLDVVINGLKR